MKTYLDKVKQLKKLEEAFFDKASINRTNTIMKVLLLEAEGCSLFLNENIFLKEAEIDLFMKILDFLKLIKINTKDVDINLYYFLNEAFLRLREISLKSFNEDDYIYNEKTNSWTKMSKIKIIK